MKRTMLALMLFGGVFVTPGTAFACTTECSAGLHDQCRYSLGGEDFDCDCACHDVLFDMDAIELGFDT